MQKKIKILNTFILFVSILLPCMSMANPLDNDDHYSTDLIQAEPPHFHVVGWFKNFRVLHHNLYQLTLEIAGKDKIYTIYTFPNRLDFVYQRLYNSLISHPSTPSIEKPMIFTYSEKKTEEESAPEEESALEKEKSLFLDTIKTLQQQRAYEQHARANTGHKLAKYFLESHDQNKARERLEMHLEQNLSTLPYTFLGIHLQKNASVATVKTLNNQPLYVYMQYNPLTKIDRLSDMEKQILSDETQSLDHPITVQNMEAIIPLHSFSSDPLHTATELIAWYHYLHYSGNENRIVNSDPQTVWSQHFYDSRIFQGDASLTSDQTINCLHFVDESLVSELKIPELESQYYNQYYNKHKMFRITGQYHQAPEHKIPEMKSQYYEHKIFGIKGQYHQAYVVSIQHIRTNSSINDLDQYGFFSVDQVKPALITLLENGKTFNVYTKDAALIQFAQMALKTNVQVVVTTHKILCPKREKDLMAQNINPHHYQYMSSIGLSLNARLAVAIYMNSTQSVYPPASSQSNQTFYHLMSDLFTDKAPKAERLLMQTQSNELSYFNYIKLQPLRFSDVLTPQMSKKINALSEPWHSHDNIMSSLQELQYRKDPLTDHLFLQANQIIDYAENLLIKNASLVDEMLNIIIASYLLSTNRAQPIDTKETLYSFIEYAQNKIQKFSQKKAKRANNSDDELISIAKKQKITQ